MITTLAILFFATLGCAALFVDRSRAETARLRQLVDLSAQLQVSPNVQNATRLLPAFAKKLFPRFEGALYLSRPTSPMVRLAVKWNSQREEEFLPISACNSLMIGATHVLTAQADSICEHSALTPDSETICVPLLEGGDSFGFLTLRAPSRTSLPPGSIRLAKAFAQQVALALTNLRLQETLRAAAVRDSLTGLFNRRCIAESLTLELLGGGNPNARVGVILIDVDHFKRFNDTWGHNGGDALLQQLARLMEDVFSGEDDIVCRYVGEEFVVVLPNVSLEALRSRAQHLLDRAHDLRVDCDGQLVSGITVSAGIAVSPSHANSIEGLITAADRALYAAKSSGRDRVAVPPPQVVADRNAAA
jgi:diguanylate cyclase (GGDEF)-like protein